MAKMKKVVTIPETSHEVRPAKLFVDGPAKIIQVVLDDGTNVQIENTGITVNGQLLVGSDDGTLHFNEVITEDVGTLLGTSTINLTLKKLLEEVTYGILIDREVEDSDDWETDT